MIRERRPRSSSAGCRRAIRPRPRSGCSRCRHRIYAGARLAVRARTAGLTAVDVDRALTDERSLAVTWLNRGTPQQKQKAHQPLAKAKRDRRQRGAAQAKPATDSELHLSAGVHPLHPRTAHVRARPGASRSHRSVGPHTFAKTGRLVVESACSPTKGSCADLALDRHHHRCCFGHPWLLWPGTLLQVAAPQLTSFR
jgi:hypothetical protein